MLDYDALNQYNEELNEEYENVEITESMRPCSVFITFERHQDCTEVAHMTK